MEPPTPEASLNSNELQMLLVNELRKLEIAIANLSDRVGKEESLLTHLEQDVKNLGEHPQDGSDPVSREGTLKLVEQQLERLEARMSTGERRLSNQEQAVQTISRVIQSMTNLVEEDGACRGENWSPGPDNLPVLSQLFPKGRTPATSSAALPAGLVERTRQQSPLQARSFATGMGDRMPARPLPQEGDPETDRHTLQLPHQATYSAVPPTDAETEEFPALQRDGEQLSAGSVSHPNNCRPCSFYCFSKRGCKKGPACEYCHMLHISRSNQRKPKDNLRIPATGRSQFRRA